MSEVNYTDEMVKVLKAVLVLDWEGAKVLGEKLGKTPGSIVAKFKSEGGVYKAKEKKEPVGTVNKKVYVKSIETKLGFVLVSLDKMTKVDLIKLDKALVAEVAEAA